MNEDTFALVLLHLNWGGGTEYSTLLEEQGQIQFISLYCTPPIDIRDFKPQWSRIKIECTVTLFESQKVTEVIRCPIGFYRLHVATLRTAGLNEGILHLTL